MKTTLLYPGIAGYGFNSLGQGMEAGWVSHGLAHLSAAAKSQGLDIDLIDLRALRDWDHFRQVLQERAPDVVGITMMSVDYNPATEAARIIKDALPETVVIIGGPHPTLDTLETANVSHFDYIVTHEGEITFPKLLASIRDSQEGTEPQRHREYGDSEGENQENLRTLRASVVNTPLSAWPRVIRGEMPDLDTLPFPDRELFLNEWRKYGYTSDSPEAPFVEELPPPFLTIIAGRGCMYNCSYCQPAEKTIFGKKVRKRSPANIIGELKQLRERYHFASFMFHDDCLTENRPWVTEFCQLYMAEGFTQPFFCQSRADILVRHEDMVALMAQAGCKGYFIGFESGSDRVLRFIRKGTTRKINLEAGQVCRKYGIKIWANYMLGLPTETPDEVRETVSLLKELDPDYYSTAFYTPHPGSDLYDYCLENGLSLIVSHDQYRRNPTETKIKGQDYAFLKWALEESQKRTLANRFRRWRDKAGKTVRRYANPRKVVRKIMQLLNRSTHV